MIDWNLELKICEFDPFFAVSMCYKSECLVFSENLKILEFTGFKIIEKSLEISSVENEL